MSKLRLSALLVVALLTATAVLFVAGCGGGGGGEGSTLTVGSDVPYPPFEEFGKTKTEFKGFDVELVEAIGEKIGRKVEFMDTSFETIFRDLAQGKFDMVASATTITPEREKTVDFSNPYYFAEQSILVKKGSKINSVEKLNGVIVAAQQGTTGQAFVQKETKPKELRAFPEGPDAVNALKAGTVEAVVIDLPVAEHAVELSPSLEVSAKIPTEEEYGFAVKQGNKKLLDELNEGLKEVEEDGTYTKIYEKWLHTEPPKAIFSATHTAT